VGVAVRDRNLRLLVSAKEQRMVRAIAKKTGLSIADVVRQLIRAEHQLRFPDEYTPVMRESDRKGRRR
jgi:hypothetical protein